MSQISVIVPVYKVEPFLHRCVEGIVAQTFTDFELVLVDDGSPDNCGAICDEYAKQDDRIHVIHQKNGGLSAARNAGIDWTFANSDCEWISFIDSDDWVHPRFLEYLYRAVDETKAKVSACLPKRVTEEEPFRDQEFQVKLWNWEEYYIHNWGVLAWNKLYKKELFEVYRYPVGKIHEDEFLTYRLLEKAGTIAAIESELYFYFQNADGIINKEFSLARLNALDALAEQCKFAKEKGYVDFYYSRMKARAELLCGYIFRCRSSTSIASVEKKKAIHKMRSELRKILMLEGKKIAPFKEKQLYYDLAFPLTSKIYWKGKKIIGKIKELF